MRRGLLLAVLVVSCSTEVDPRAGDGAAQPKSPDAARSATERCGPVPADAIALVDGPHCGAAVVAAASSTGWQLQSLVIGGEDKPAALQAPEICAARPCRLSGNHGPDGTALVLIGVPSAGSELFDAMWLVSPGAPPVSLWHDGPVEDDATDLGPAWGLWPHACEGGVALLPAPRFDDGAEGEPSPRLVAAATWLDASKAAPLPQSGSCTPIEIADP